MPQFNDIMVYKNAANVAETKEFNTQIQALSIPNEIKDGYLRPVIAIVAQILAKGTARLRCPVHKKPCGAA